MSNRLSEIEARLAAATPGPWWWRNTSEPYLQGARTRIVMAFRRMGTQGAQPQFRDEHGLLVDSGKANINDFPDATLIAHAPSDIAALLLAVKAVQAARRDLSHHHAHYVPGRWDKDGSICDVCVRVGAMDAALAALEG